MKAEKFLLTALIALSVAGCNKGNDATQPSASAPGNAKPAVVPGSLAPKAPGAAQSQPPLFHGDMKANPSAGSRILAALKNDHLKLSADKTIGQVFDGYKFGAKKEWRETPTENGPYYIDYVCWLDNSASLPKGVAKQGFDVKFVIQRDGQTYVGMSSRVDMARDGKVKAINLQPPETEKLVTAIYENREITF